jgi:nucleoid DNA-binding protein
MLPIKETIIKELSAILLADKLISENIIDKVISHQFDSALKATVLHNSVELSGFGKFSFSQKKAQRQMTKYNEQIIYYTEKLNNSDSDAEKRNLSMRIDTTLNNIKVLTPKIKTDE